MNNLVTHTAIVGRTLLMPGILPVKVDSPEVQCLVAHAFPASIKNEYHKIDLGISDCTLFTVTHIGLGDIDLSDATNAEKLLEQALMAISEVIIWNKAMDQVGSVTAFTRQVGRLDVKFFFIDRSNNRLIAWKNPLFWSDRQSAALMAGILSNMIVNNGPAASPVAGIIRRVMSSLDLSQPGLLHRILRQPLLASVTFVQSEPVSGNQL